MEIIEKLKKELNNNPDVLVREVKVSSKNISMIFLKSTTDKNLFVHSVISPLLDYKGEVTLDNLKNEVLKVSEIEEIEEKDFLEKILKNKVLLFVDGETKALCLDLELIPTRQPEEPPTSPTIQGPREGFTESIKTTISLIRKQIPSEHLVIKNFFVGEISHTQVSLFYLDNIADKKIVKKIEKKIKKINIDGILDAHYIVEFITERPNSLFEQYGSTEKPDIVTAKLLEGRIAIAVDGSPIVITLPFLIFEDLQNSNDYYTNAHYTTLMRYIRALGIIMATVVPGVYLSLRLYHYKVVPLKYILTINATTQNLPFTPFIELLFILILFQMLYEVSLRLPRYLGIATSIVGALVLGDTGVQAGLISPPGIIVIALSLISVYTVPNQAPQLTILRFLFLMIGGTLGLLGIVGAMIYFVNYLNTMNDFDTPNLAPYSPRVANDLKDAIHRSPITEMKKRPGSIPNKDNYRGVNNQDEWLYDCKANSLLLCDINACIKTCCFAIYFNTTNNIKCNYCYNFFDFFWFFDAVYIFKNKRKISRNVIVWIVTKISRNNCCQNYLCVFVYILFL